VVLSCNLIVIVHFCFVLFLYLLLYKKKKEETKLIKDPKARPSEKAFIIFFKRLLKICNISRDTNVIMLYRIHSIHIIWRKLRITFISKILNYPFEQTPVSLWTLYIFKSDFNGTVFQKVAGSSWDRAVGLENS